MIAKAAFLTLLTPALLLAGASHQRFGLSKMDAQLKLWVTNPSLAVEAHPSQHGMPVVSLIFKAHGSNIQDLVAKHGGQVNSEIGVIYTADIPLDNIEKFAEEAAIEKIESPQILKLHNDKGRISTGAEKVNNGQLPGGIPYTGKGVIVGVIDTGLDFLHPDFRSTSDATKTRIISIWDQVMADGVKPTGFAYGTEWKADQINAELVTPGVVTEKDSSGHGTHVMGTSGGVRGIAYEADLVAVKTKLVGNGDYTFANTPKTLDACNYIYKLAEARNQPAVVNLSLGFVFGAPHDGTSLYEQGMDQLVAQRPGYVICASAGNEGSDKSHFTVDKKTNDSIWTYVPALNGATWYGVVERVYDTTLSFCVSLDTAGANFQATGIGIGARVFTSPWYNLKALKDSTSGIHYAFTMPNGDTISTIRLIASNYDNTRSEFYVYPRDKSILRLDTGRTRLNLYKIHVKGTGVVHAWSEAINGFGLDPTKYGARTDSRFVDGDNRMGIGIPATAKNVLAVGAHINKINYVDIKGITRTGLNTANAKDFALATFSSVGPTYDGRIKPDFTAPGVNVASSASRYAEHDSTTMVDANTAVFSGTSMACPFTVGTVALYLEKNPTALWSTVLKDIKDNTSKDINTTSRGPLPNIFWGAGKLNIFRAMGGKEPDLSSNADTLAYGSIKVGTSTFKDVVLSNPGQDTVSFNVDLSGSGAASYKITSPTSTQSLSLAPGKKLTMTLEFKPDALGAKDAVLNATNSANKDVQVVLTGTGADQTGVAENGLESDRRLHVVRRSGNSYALQLTVAHGRQVNASLRLVDNLGRTTATLLQGAVSESREIEIDLTSYASGLYHVVGEIDGVAQRVSLVLSK